MNTTNWESIEAINSKRVQLFQQIHSYGDIIPLNMVLDCQKIETELSGLADRWVGYNQIDGKRNNPREGMSVTSLDGQMTGIPDLFSLYEWSKESGRKVSERDFNQTTEAYRSCQTIHPVIEPFLPNVGRCRFVRFGAGGHFPPHRDGSVNFQIPDYFRILVPLTKTGADAFHFVFDGRLVPYEVGRPYLFNALKTHSVVSFLDGALTLAVSVGLTQANVATAISMFKVY